MAVAPVPDTLDLAPLAAVLDRFEGRTGALIPILQAAQGIYGYLPAEVLQAIADRLNVSLGKIYGVATFYAQFYLQQRGRHILRVCDGTACHVKGAPALLTAVEESYGIAPDETTGDGQLTMEIVYCMGSCALAPVAVLDGQVVGRVKRETLLRQLERDISSAAALPGAGEE
ncbi:MAG: NAD(P)H-dependent oxidoreductase subunit E [Anaerolineae bacterium]|jgi:NADH-quinone oxidoreductase subunit E|nr:NAD(P)H-dependent oxidoreductase subunit E [Anaerolineae bacterium]